MRKKLLLSGLGGSPFPYLHNQLSNKYDLYYIDSDEHLSKLYEGFNFYIAPLVNNPDYFDFVEKVLVANQIDFYIPLIDEEIVEAKNRFDKKFGVKVIAPDSNFSSLCIDKYALMHSLLENNISNIKSLKGDHFANNTFFPVFLKPNSGRGSRGIRKINTQEELEAYYVLEKYDPKDILVQEFVTGDEFTVGVSVNNQNQLMSISTRRVIKKKGITQIAVNENCKIIEEAAEKIIQIYKPSGPFNIQLYLTDKKEAKIFEINPRYSTTIIMSYAAGIDEISLFIDNYGVDKLDFPLQKPAENIILHRRWENCFYEKL